MICLIISVICRFFNSKCKILLKSDKKYIGVLLLFIKMRKKMVKKGVSPKI